ncbi:MAG: hypothetical protein ABI550_02065 [Ignavibacteriaceae bacterium]
MKKSILLLFICLSFFGCDSIYRYVFLPPERVEYTLTPDSEAINELADTSYYISKDGKTLGFNAKDWKFEIKYLSDYQLNTFEFPEESKKEELSGNPFTYGNLIDPQLGYTPRRFTVFKVTIYNYTGSKLNYDPELSTLQTDRGDLFHGYGREKKNAKYTSIEEYYNIRKGTSGVDDDVYETRMGIARRNMLYYGKPIYKGDSRDGLIVFDPIVNSVEKLKITINDFILSYDENNEPSEFKDLIFYFKQIPFEGKDEGITTENAFVENADSTKNELSGTLKVAQINYVNDLSQFGNEELNSNPQIRNNPWDPKPGAISNLMDYIKSNTPLKTQLEQTELKESDNFDLLIITGVDGMPILQNTWKAIQDEIQDGAFVFFDIAKVSASRRLIEPSTILNSIKVGLKGKTEIKNVSFDHPLFSAWKKFSSLPEGYEIINNTIEPSYNLTGLFLEGKLVAAIAKKSYVMMWDNDDNKAQLNFGVNIAAYAFKNKSKK